jgi:UDP-N-acetylmuramate dehydrogenase
MIEPTNHDKTGKPTLEKDILLASYTSILIGGKARLFGEANSIQQLTTMLYYAEREDLPVFVMGGGTNLLISDKGFDGMVIRLNIRDINIDQTSKTCEVGAGYNLWRMIDRCIHANLGGMENMAGIPGTVGGAIRGNAGAYQTEIQDVLESVTYLERGKLKTISNSECDFSYRDSMFKRENDMVIISAKFKLYDANESELSRTAREIVIKREIKQPLNYPNAGSFFKNPIIANDQVPSIDDMPKWEVDKHHTKLSAGWLIEKAGLKGYRINDAGYSEKHALFIVNYGRATSRDVVDLMLIGQSKVREMFGIELYPEPELVGF